MYKAERSTRNCACVWLSCPASVSKDSLCYFQVRNEAVMMEWNKLLSSKRVRDLLSGEPTRKVDREFRSEFERDYGRAIFSSPVRRLQDKAQVFPLEPLDAIRTRLTHSLEVSSVARSMAEELSRWMEKSGYLKEQSFVREIPTIAATCGLIHDIGNPPFGHAGEDAIRSWFEKQVVNDPLFFGPDIHPESQFALDFLRFDGNAQTLRLMAQLQVLADNFGLNLTCGTLSATCKYVAKSSEVSGRAGDKRHELSKLGYFHSEERLIELVRDETGSSHFRNPITYLVEAADDIVYSLVDLEDGVKKGVVKWNQLEQGVRDRVENDQLFALALKKAREMVGKAEMSEQTKDEAMAQAFRTFAIAVVVPSVIDTFKGKYLQIMRGEYHGELIDDSAAVALIKACKVTAGMHVYRAHEIIQLEVMGRRVIHDLMDLFWAGAEHCDETTEAKDHCGKMYKLISKNYRKVFEKALADVRAKVDGMAPERYYRLQLVVDEVAGMTDTFACTLHKRLTNG